MALFMKDSLKGKTSRVVFASYLAFLAVMPFGEMPLLGTREVFTVTKAAFLFLMAGLAWAAIRGWRPRMAPAVYGVLALFLAGTLAAALFSLDMRHSIVAWVRVPSMVMLGLATFWLVDEERGRARVICWWCLGLAAIFSALGIYQTMTGSTIANFGYYSVFGRLMSVAVSDVPGSVTLVRASATFDHPGFFGNYLALILPFGVLMLDGRRWSDLRTWGLVAVLVAGMLALVCTLSRGAWLGMAAALVVIGIGRASARIGWVIFAAAFALALVLIPADTRPILISRSHQTQYYDGTRLVSYQTAMRILVRHPLLGIGPDMFNRMFKLYAPPGIKIRQNPAHHMDAHNTFLDLGAETGAAGLLPFLAILGWGMVRVCRLARPCSMCGESSPADDRLLALALAAALAAFVIQSVFLSLEYQEIFWVILGIIVAVILPSDRGNTTQTMRRN